MRTLACLCALAALAGAENLIANGGFENGTADWSLVPFSDQAQYDVVTDETAEGGKALRLTKAGGSKIDTAFANFDLKPRHLEGTLKVSVHVKAKGLGQGRFVLIFYNGNGDIAAEHELHRKRLKKTFRWKKLEIDAKIPDDAVGGRLLLQVFRKGTLWLDDVQAVPSVGAAPAPAAVTGGTSLLENGGFESEREGWAFVSFSQQARYEFDRKDKREGKVALRVTKPGGAKIDTAFANFDVPAEFAGGRVTVTAQVRGDQVGGARLVFILYDASGGLVVNEELSGQPLAGTFDWRELGKTVPIDDSVVSGRVLLQVMQKGAVWLDGIRVVAVAGKEAAAAGGKKSGGANLRNGDFDRSYSGWRKARVPDGTLTSRIDRTVVASGKGALRLERKASRRYPVESVETSVRVKKTRRNAVLVFQAKTEATTRAVAVLVAYDRRGAMLAWARTEVKPRQDFAAKRLALKVPRGTDRVGVTLGIAGTGRVWFDDVSLEG